MGRFEKAANIGIGAGAMVLFEFLLVEGVLLAGGAYDLANDGYLADFLESGNMSELLDFHELNPGEFFGTLAILVSLMFLVFNLRGKSDPSHGVPA